MNAIGFIGLGTMGQPMARNLLLSGHALTVYARRPQSAAPLVGLGAVTAGSPAELARRCDVIFTIVTADADVSDLALGPHGLASEAAPGKLLVDMSTIAPQTVRTVGERLRAKGMAMLDAPVSGGPAGAAAATLAIMAGGERADFERARPLLDCMGKHVFHVGPLGSGQTMKLVNQLMGAGIMALIGEGFALARAAGANLDLLADVISVSSGNSSLFEARARKFILAQKFTPGFMLRLMHKDLRLALDLARQNSVSLPVAAATLEQYTAAMALGYADQDFSAVSQLRHNAVAAGSGLNDPMEHMKAID